MDKLDRQVELAIKMLEASSRRNKRRAANILVVTIAVCLLLMGLILLIR